MKKCVETDFRRGSDAANNVYHDESNAKNFISWITSVQNAFTIHGGKQLVIVDTTSHFAFCLIVCFQEMLFDCQNDMKSAHGNEIR